VTDVDLTVKKYFGKELKLICAYCGILTKCKLYVYGLFLCENCAKKNPTVKLFNKENLKL
jgi:hypothetical protein